VGHGIFSQNFEKKAPPPRIFTKIAGNFTALAKLLPAKKAGTRHVICVVRKFLVKKPLPQLVFQKFCRQYPCRGVHFFCGLPGHPGARG
jgi:hypothetical protein